MKTITLSALILFLFTVTCRSDWYTLYCVGTNTSASYSIPAGTYAETVWGEAFQTNSTVLVTVSNYTYPIVTSAISPQAYEVFPMLVGPATVTITNGSGYLTFHTHPASSVVTNLPSTAVVIPSDATGPVQIILESSSDLINWTPSLPGIYGSTSTNRFFRVRAVTQ